MHSMLPRAALFVFAASFLIFPAYANAATTAVQNTDVLEKARVVSVDQSGTSADAWSGVKGPTQTLTTSVLDGPDAGRTVSFENDYTQLSVGDVFYARHITSINDGTDLWSVSDPDRLPVLIGLALVFFVLVLLFGGLPGIRGIVSLAGSIALIFYVLLPGVYAGFSPALVAIGVAGLIIVVGSYVTHGFNRTTSSAVLGMLGTVLITGALAWFVIHAARLSGFTSENNVYLNFSTGGKIDMVGLLYGGIMIGLLGVLYDIAIGQAVAVEELFRAGAQLARKQVFARALRIGREHIGALVNTLAIAYVGASLPLLLLFKDATAGIGYVINSELFATEIIRILIGSIGLVLAVPITTLVATYFLSKKLPGKPSAGHSHAHE